MFWLIFIIALWGIVHSLLASISFKNFLRRIVPPKFGLAEYNDLWRAGVKRETKATAGD